MAETRRRLPTCRGYGGSCFRNDISLSSFESLRMTLSSVEGSPAIGFELARLWTTTISRSLRTSSTRGGGSTGFCSPRGSFFLTTGIPLCGIGPRYPLSILRALETIKVASTRRINARQNISAGIAQGRFPSLGSGQAFDRALRTVKEYHETVEYIHRNPVRRGLVARPEDWPWSSVHECRSPRRVPPSGWPPLRIDRVRIPADERTRI